MDDFNKIYDDLIKSLPQDFLDLQKAATSEHLNFKKKFLIYLLLIVVIIFFIDYLVIFIVFQNNINYMIWIYLVSLPIMYVIGFKLYHKLNEKKTKYLNEYRTKVVDKFLKFIWNDATYSYLDNIPKIDFKTLFAEKSYTHFVPTEYISSAINKQDLIFITLEESDFKPINYSYKIYYNFSPFTDHKFNGIEGRKILNKSIGFVMTTCYNRVSKATFNHDFHDIFVPNDRSQFSGFYDTLSNNILKTTQYLLPEVKQKLVDVLNKYNFNIEFTINNNILYYRIPLDQKTFLSNDVTNSLDRNTIYQYYLLFKFINEYIECLNTSVDSMGVYKQNGAV